MSVLDAQLQQYLDGLQAKNASAHTIKNYLADLNDFAAFVLTYSAAPSTDLLIDWSRVDAQCLQTYLSQRFEEGLSAASIARKLSSLRSFFGFLVQRNLLALNPTVGLKAPKRPKPLPKSIDVDLTAQLLEQPQHTWQEVRDQAIFELLYSAGLRVSECTQLDLSPGLDSLQAGWVQVLGKGAKERLAPVGSQALQALNRWLQIRAAHAAQAEQAVFVNRFGGRLSVRSVQMRLDKRALEAGMPTKMSPHRLRHACATHVLESSGDLRAVQEMLGHENLSTTQIYTKLDMQHLAKVYDAAHPRAKKRRHE
ncbi:tyrosine recombinase XerC [Thiosulfatimonas sediminis]|uniref:Tyrosine recombinase XerC n=1 Tax=Thiosulfatimonas sediminis TaxID=2675054 RepID=A0A6F8PSI5_9GAMM|nr:tyrosine recombinase XerC [Thiosulfatimonas sediminis]BBP45069.1 tyrosine recombinase XerC [Thiosulfatimonas sediminis]